MSSQLSDKDKVILTGRIYPAIQSCVANRYKIVSGYFATLGILIFVKDKPALISVSDSAFFVAIIFAIFVAHNTVNYYLNAYEKYKIEENDNNMTLVNMLLSKEHPWIETVSFVVMLGLIGSSYYFLKPFHDC